MGGLALKMMTMRGLLATALEDSGYRLKRPGEMDAEGYRYTLVTPEVFLWEYPHVSSPIETLPSVLMEDSEVSYGKDSMDIGVRLTIGVWSSGLHGKDIFAPAGDGTYVQGTGGFDLGGIDGSALDLRNFEDTLTRILKGETGREMGITENEPIVWSIIEDDELSGTGIRFASTTITIHVGDTSAPADDDSDL